MSSSDAAIVLVALVSLLGTLYSATAARSAQREAHTVKIDARWLAYLDKEVREAQESIDRMREKVRAAEEETDRERDLRRKMQREVDSLTDAMHRMARSLQLMDAPVPADVHALLNFPEQKETPQ